MRGRLEHFWCARGAMDIEGGGEALAGQLVKQALVRDVAWIYILADAGRIGGARTDGGKVGAKFFGRD